jgi:hypothetical protein
MTVHIGELHADVSPAPSANPPAPTPGPASPEPADQRVRAEWVARRVCAEGFDD